MILRYHHFPLFLLFIFLLAATSCEKFSGDQTIPAYLSIDSIYLTTDYPTQGSSSQRITDAWVYVDDQYIGTFELPARFPVLYEGKHTITIWPGIKKNGIAATRTSYNFYNSVKKVVSLTQDSTTGMGILKTTYQSTTLFPFREDFEDVAIALDTTNRSTAWITTTKSADSTFEGLHSGKVVLDSIHDFFECQTRDEYAIPSAPVYLEMNFNTTNSITVGVVVYGFTSLYQSPVITLNPTNGQWKKIYIDLTTTLNAYSGMITYRVYLGTFKDTGLNQGILLFDNLKVVTRKS